MLDVRSAFNSIHVTAAVTESARDSDHWTRAVRGLRCTALFRITSQLTDRRVLPFHHSL